MTGVSHMLPFVTAGGLLIALAFAFGGIYVFDDAHKGTLAWTLFTIGAKSGFALMVPVLAGFIAHSIADRAGLAPGMIGGMIAVSIGAGFFGGIAAGFLAGYTVRWLNRHIRLGRNLDGLKPVLILPLLGTLVVGLLMYYVVGRPVALLLNAVTPGSGAAGFQRHPAGPAAGVHDGLRHGRAHQQGGLHVRHRADRQRSLRAHGRGDGRGDDRSLGRCPGHRAVPEPVHRRGAGSGKATAVLGLAFITEGAIPFAAKDPFRVIPSLMLGSAVAGALSMVLGCQLRVPHGGFFVLPIPNAVLHLGAYLAAIAAGTLLSAVVLGALKRPLHPDLDETGRP